MSRRITPLYGCERRLEAEFQCQKDKMQNDLAVMGTETQIGFDQVITQRCPLSR